MPFKPGNKLSPGTGRPKGSRNKRTLEAIEVLAKHNFNPIEALLEIYLEARKIYSSYGTIHEAINEAREEKGLYPTDDKSHVYLKIAADAAADIASYTFPKLKAIEHSKTGPLTDMTPEQRLEAMKQAVKALEAQVEVTKKSE